MKTKIFEEMSNVLTLSQSLTPPVPHTAVAHKRKANNKNDTGLKWFKGSPKKSSQKFRLLKSSQQESLPTFIAPTIAARVVEFDIEGTVERVGVTERLPIVEGNRLSELHVKSKVNSVVEVQEVPLSAFPGRKSKVKAEKGKVKSKRNGKVYPNLLSSDKARKDSTETNQSTALPQPNFCIHEDINEQEVFDRPNAYIRYMETHQEDLSDEVEYDLEEEDIQWLELANEKRKKQGFSGVEKRNMELMMDRLEKESYFQMQSTGMDHCPPIDDDAVCCICMDGECQNSNAILFCDMCNLAVHQDCYGVPYIPEGQWLCRKCLHSPSRAVECILCPNRGGALKGTDDGRWAHVACAIWIPEVCFANTVFLEPIESIGNIPPARWRLTCFICKQKGIGACIQCYKSSCYTAFHVTCAQQANLVMKMETVREMHMTSVIIKKTAYCNNHAPPELLLEKKLKEGVELASPRMKMKQTRKLLAEKRDAIPVVLIPTIPRNRITKISNSICLPGKNTFMKRLMSYWKLKRQFRNGVPLLRRLQMASSAPNSKPCEGKPKNGGMIKGHGDDYKSWIRLRQDLERARILCEMIRKREKYKRELIYAKVKVAEMKICPMNLFFLNILNEIIFRDQKEIFRYPVDVDEVPDYRTMIEEPMDLTTMTDKVKRFEYHSIKDIEQDFNLMINNCLHYNDKDTIYYKTAIRIRNFGGGILRKAKKVFENIGYDAETGLHLSETQIVAVSVPVETSTCKCNNSSNCNNNCKNNTITTPHIPDSFSTYRQSVGDGVETDSDEENDLERSMREGDEFSDDDSESTYSSSSSTEESGDGDMTNMHPSVDSDSDSEDDSSNDSMVMDESEPELAEATPASPHSQDEVSFENGNLTNSINTSSMEFNHTGDVDEGVSESESESSCSTTSSSSNEIPPLNRRRRID